ncbi:MAG: amidohydrolase family protein [Acidimicrobiia bacterium]
MLREDQKLISVDDHIIEHPRVWLDRLPQRFQDAAPRVVDVPLDDPVREGSDAPMQQWLFNGEIAGDSMLSCSAGIEWRDRAFQPQSFETIRRGCVDPAARLADMDAEGVWAQVNFPNWAGFAGGRFRHCADRELANACVAAYNDFVLDEWCPVAPDRYVPMVITPFWDGEAAADELARCAAKGAKAFSFPDNPAHLGYPSFQSDHWERLWDVAEAADLPVCMHFGSGGVKHALSDEAPMMAWTSVMGSTLSHSMVELCFSPVFHNHPDLKIVYSEGQIGWIPYFVMRMDQVWDRYRWFRPVGKMKKRVNDEIPPSELFRRHVWGCFIDDPVGVQTRELIGVDKIMFEADYPHDDSHWPTTRADIAKQLADVPDDQVKMIVEDNARNLFNFPAR